MTEEYYVFWGDYNVREKYTSKFKSNSDWAIYLPGKCNKFDLVKKSREYLESEDSISEEKERFADQFKPASRKGRQAKKNERTFVGEETLRFIAAKDNRFQRNKTEFIQLNANCELKELEQFRN